MSPYPKVIVQTFENYAKSQLTFVQNVAELAAKPAYVECLFENNAVETVMSLVTNVNPSVRVNAVLGLARMAGHSESCAKQTLCSKGQLNRLFGQIAKENKYYKKNCMNLVRNLSKHTSVSLEIIVKECGGLDAILSCIKDFDPMVRESALQAIGSIARQDASISQFVATSGVLPPIVMCLKDKEHNLKSYALSTLDEMAKHNQELAQTIVDVPTLPYVTNFLSPKFMDVKVQRNALILIKNIVKHSLFLTENAIESNLFPDVLTLTKHPDESIRDNAAKVICEVVKHSVQIAQMVVNNGGIAALTNVISCGRESSSVSAVLALGYVAAMSPLLASAVIQSKALPLLTAILKSDKDMYTKAGVVWTLGMIGRHGPEHAREICACDAVTSMMDIYAESNPEDEGRHKSQVALQIILNECDDYAVLESLLARPPPVEITTYILDKISKILPNNSKARRSFITNGHLKSIQSLTADVDPRLSEVIKAVNCCFPEDVLQMVAGDFPETVMKTVDKYVPKSNCLLYNHQLNSDELNKSHSSAKYPVSGAEESLFG